MDPDPGSELIYDPFFIAGLLAILILLFFSALISAAEVALFSLDAKTLGQISASNSRKDKSIAKLLEKPKKLLATLLITDSFLTMSIVVLFFNLPDRIFSFIESDAIRVVIDIIVLTFVILLFGDVLPKVFANQNSLKFARFFARPLLFLDFLFSPISIPMRNLSRFLNQKLGKSQRGNFSVDQLSQALELTSSEGTSKEEQKILEGIVSFGNTETRQVMSPRIDIFALDITLDFPSVLEQIVEKGFSRIPVYSDNVDQIEGVLFAKDLLPHIGKTEFDWKTLLRDPYFVPENKKLDNLLKDFQTLKNHLAIVVDEYGGTSGIVTLEDVIEEIVGDISDEFDDDNISYSQLDEKNFMFEGKINLKDFYRIMNLDEEIFETQKGEAETLAGFLLELLGNFPKKGQRINFENFRFTIESVDRKRIKQIKVTIE